MKLKAFLIFAFMLGTCLANPCTLGVATGEATADGRPMLWKTRDYEVKPNVIFFTQTDKYNFISNITPDYGFNQSWFGLNEKGFAIANTFIAEFPEGTSGLGNGEFMHEALRTCSSVNEFIELMDSTNIAGRKTRAVFGVIDTTNAAMIFEVGGSQYRKFDAHDTTIAPDGYIIRTNFTVSKGGTRGIERFKRSSGLINGFYKNDKLNVKSILQSQMRDMADAQGNPVSSGFLNCRTNICTPNSIAATVIQGVKENEPGFLTTMWAMLGNPFVSVAVPYWPVGKTPEISSSGSGKSLYAVSGKLKALLFDSSGTGNLDVVKTLLIQDQIFEAEDQIYINTNGLLKSWRQEFPTYREMLDTEKEFADYALKTLKKILTVKR